MALYPYNPDEDKPIFDEHGNRLYSIPTGQGKNIFNADGEKLSKRTLLIPQKRGFGNKELAKKINRGGRPKGSKVKSTLNDAIKRFENNQLEAALLIIAVMNGDEKTLGEKVKLSERVGAARYVIEAPEKMKKSRDSDKNSAKNSNQVSKEEGKEEEDKEEEVRPLISLTVSSSGET